jgi:hypothetical protein
MCYFSFAVIDSKGQSIATFSASPNLETLQSHPRGPKKTRRQRKRTRPVKRPHISTAKILVQNKAAKSTP